MQPVPWNALYAGSTSERAPFLGISLAWDADLSRCGFHPFAHRGRFAPLSMRNEELFDMANGYLTPWRSGSLSRSPFGGGSLFDLNRQMNRLFDDLIESPAGSPGSTALAATGWPQLEIDQQDDQIRVVAELPGVNENDVELMIEDGVLSLTGEKRCERKDESGYSERSYGR